MPFWRKKPVISGPTNVKGNYAQGNAKFQEVKRAYESAMAYGGVPTMPFAQGLGFVRDVWKPYYSGTGICQALVNYWLIDHAMGGSLWNRIFNGGQIDPNALQVIAVQQSAFGTDDGKGTDGKLLQKIRSAAFLRQKGLIPRNDIATGGSTLFTGSKGDAFDPSLGLRLGLAICYEGMANATEGSYRMISLTSDTISHVVCAFVQRDIAFFDPNYGEFWFEDKSKFAAWFAKFWITDTYGNFSGYQIRDYAMKVGRH